MKNLNYNKPIIAVTMGDPSGIGPEILASSLGSGKFNSVCTPLIIGDLRVLKRVNKEANWYEITNETDFDLNELSDNDIPVLAMSALDKADSIPGIPSTAGGSAQLSYVEKSIELAIKGKVNAIVTGPINKNMIMKAGSIFPGHTGLLAERTGAICPLMLLAGPKLRVALSTEHIPLSEVAKALNNRTILAQLRVLNSELHFVTGSKKPTRIAVAGLNPHCSDGGLIGYEEDEVIAPAVESAVNEGIDVIGPLPADSVFYRAYNGEFDAVLAMYHDQGLAPLKLVHFAEAVNITLGLPVVRTSVDHGVAYDIAGRGIASIHSMKSAVELAIQMVLRKR